MSLAIVKKVRATYPTPLGKQHAAFLIELAQAIPGAGLLKKTSGTRIKLPKPYNVEVAQDILCLFDGSILNHYDVLKDGEGKATPTWSLVGPIDSSRYVSVSTPLPPPTPDPEPEPDIRVLIAGLSAKLDAQHAAVVQRLDGLYDDNRRPRRVTGSAGWIGSINGEVSGVE